MERNTVSLAVVGAGCPDSGEASANAEVGRDATKRY